jgi:hypothetical protein
MTTHMTFQEWNKFLDNISYSNLFHLEFDPLKSYHWFSTNSQIIIHKFSLMEFEWILMDEIKLWWVIFHQWHKFNDISWIWTLFHQVNFILHGIWTNLNGWNQIMNELYFITNIKLLMTFTDLNFISSSALHHPWKLDES